MSKVDPHAFVLRHGVVLVSARGPVPNLAEAIAGEPIAGAWLGHAKGTDIYLALEALERSGEVLDLKLIDGKATLVHRRLWPALVRLAPGLGPSRLTVYRQEQTSTGKDRSVRVLFPKWVPVDVLAAAERLSEAEARSLLGGWASAELEGLSAEAPAPRAARRGGGRPPDPDPLERPLRRRLPPAGRGPGRFRAAEVTSNELRLDANAEEMLTALRRFRRAHGHLAIPNAFPHDQLYAWCAAVRRARGRLSPALAAQLATLKVPVTQHAYSWELNFSLLREELDRGRAPGGLSPRSPVALWLERQRARVAAHRLDDDRATRLRELGLV